MIGVSLAERFARDQGKPQIVDGVTVHGIFRCRVTSGARVYVRRLRVVQSPVQGLRVNVDGGSLRVAGSA